jgi:nucleoside-diphosphate-sugar epimerase
MTEHVVVAGASGIVGAAAAAHFAARGFRVTALSRRAPLPLAGVSHRAIDLRDADAAAALAGDLRDATRLVYAALHEKPGLVAGWREADQIDTNERMLRNLLAPLDRAAPALRHVTLLQGTKAYGAHVRPLPVPAREDRDEARDVPNFYWRQEALLRGLSPGRGWHFTILRPQIVFGLAIGAAMNLIAALGVHAALRRARGLPLAYPGGAAPVLEAVDAELLARTIDWAGECEGARGEVFNVANGDVFAWPAVWPALAEAFGLPAGGAEPERLAESLPPRAAEWDALRERFGLAAPPLPAFVGESLHYADFCLAAGATRPLPPALVSTVKLRRAGFTEAIDTEAMLRKWVAAYQDAKLLPRREG